MKILVERYEGSMRFKEGILEGAMSVNLENDARYNDDDDFTYRLEFNQAALLLKERGLVRLEWKQRNIILSRIQFRLDNIPEFRKLAGIKPKEDILTDFINELVFHRNKVNDPWMKNYFQDLIDQVEQKKAIPASLEDKKKRKNLFLSFDGLSDNGGNEILERVFSKKYLGKSKIFEGQVRARLVGVIKKYFPMDKDASIEEVLTEFGIEKSTADLHLSGSLVIKVRQNVINLASFPHGVGLDSKTLIEAEIMELGFNRLLSIENLANYRVECEKTKGETLLVFSSGFYSPQKRIFLQKIRDFALENGKRIIYSHWGDLDFGGLRIFKHIKEKIYPDLTPYKMDVETYLANLNHAEFFESSNQRENLTNHLQDHALQEFHPLIREMLNYGRTLEQEALLFN